MTLEQTLSAHKAAIHAPLKDGYEAILTPEAMEFIVELQERFGPQVEALLAAREERLKDIRGGITLKFLPETKEIRDAAWTVAPIPQDLQDRRVEITGPVDRKMIINALNSGAKVFMADFEDSLSPTWERIIEGQINLYDAVRSTIAFTSPEGKNYALKGAYPSADVAILKIRPRGWHLEEKHITVNDKPISGALLDFGLYFFHNAQKLIELGTAPYFYLPKLEHYKEAELWNEIFVYAQAQFGIPVGTIKATVLIETITAAFQMDEILYALKEHIVGQNAGRWDYIFSYIKCHAHDEHFVCPDRGQVTMTQPFLRHYSLLLIQTCHKRGAFAMGGMSAFIPIKGDEAANEAAIEQVRKDKAREATDGHDGTWVAHPGLIPIAKACFDEHMPKPNQIGKQLDIEVSAEQLLEQPAGTITEGGIRNNVAVCLRYMAEWLKGNGCVPIFHMMEDAATAEIARTQLWQWLHHKCHLGDVPQEGEGTVINQSMIEQHIVEELDALKTHLGEPAFKAAKYPEAAELLRELVYSDTLNKFLTLGAYGKL